MRPDPYTIRCPCCLAGPGDRCWGAGRQVRVKRPHKARADVADYAGRLALLAAREKDPRAFAAGMQAARATA